MAQARQALLVVCLRVVANTARPATPTPGQPRLQMLRPTLFFAPLIAMSAANPLQSTVDALVSSCRASATTTYPSSMDSYCASTLASSANTTYSEVIASSFFCSVPGLPSVSTCAEYTTALSAQCDHSACSVVELVTTDILAHMSHVCCTCMHTSPHR